MRDLTYIYTVPLIRPFQCRQKNRKRHRLAVAHREETNSVSLTQRIRVRGIFCRSGLVSFQLNSSITRYIQRSPRCQMFNESQRFGEGDTWQLQDARLSYVDDDVEACERSKQYYIYI